MRALKPGGKLAVELLDQDQVDKKNSTWWYTDETGLWGDQPFLHLGERFWLAEAKASVERYYIVHLTTGEMTHVELCDQTYQPEEMTAMLQAAGFTAVTVHPTWDQLSLYDSDEWLVYVAS